MHPGDTNVYVINVFDKCKDRLDQLKRVCKILLPITWVKKEIWSKKQMMWKVLLQRLKILEKVSSLNIKR